MDNMEFHPIANIFPLMHGDDFDSLVASIKKNGLRDPIQLYEGMILDGRNRYNACVKAEVEPRFEDWQGSDPWEFVWDTNAERRHLPAGQKAALFYVMEGRKAEWIEAQRIRQEEANRARSKTQLGIPKSERRESNDSTRSENRTSDEAASRAGVSGVTALRTQALANARPDLLEKVASGEISLGEASRQRKRDDLQDKVPEAPEGKYRVIYADPPWKYNNSGDGIDQYGPAERHYPAMSITELETMGSIVRDMAEDNSVLFIWTTSPMLEDTFGIIRAWGFQYKTSFVWDKVKHNFGHYNSVRHEFLLVCTKGSCVPDSDDKIDSVQSIERTEHSVKPNEFRNIIDKLYTHGKRIELFARGESSDGWDTWGNESE